ncbi:MAG: hypothetical protein ACYCZO_11580 [Daejeonella sp.]
MPSLYIITGSNGAGKSTVGPDYLPEEISRQYTVFDGDLLYTRKLNDNSPQSPGHQNMHEKMHWSMW